MAASLQHQDAGSIPSLAKWVKGSGAAAVYCDSDLIPGPGNPYAAGQPGKKKFAECGLARLASPHDLEKETLWTIFLKKK